MGAPVSVEKGLGPRPLPPGADPKLAKGLAGGGRDPGRKGGAQPAGGAVSPKWIGTGTFPWEETLKAAPRRSMGRRRRRGKKDKKRGGRYIDKQIFGQRVPITSTCYV